MIPGPAIAHYFYVTRLDSDHLVQTFCVAGHADPDQYVATLAPDGTEQRWDRREENDLLVFYPPDGYEAHGPIGPGAGSQGLLWCYDQRLQRHEPLPRAELERRALNMRVSLLVNGLGKKRNGTAITPD